MIQSIIYPDAGWLAPDGSYYPCSTGLGYNLHQYVAEEIVRDLYPEADLSRYDSYVAHYMFLWNEGYYKIDCAEIYGLRPPTAAQVATLLTLYYDPMARWINSHIHNEIGRFLVKHEAV